MFINEYDQKREGHDDVKHGFAITFQDQKPDIDLVELEQKVKDLIAKDLPITYVDESHISIGNNIQQCNGPRIHVSNTSQVENFHLMPHFMYDRFKRRYLLVGCVGENAEEILAKLDIQQHSPGWH